MVIHAAMLVSNGLIKVPLGHSSAEYLGAVIDFAAQNPSASVFKLNALQRNPGQTDQDGYEIRSTDAVLLEKDESAQLDLIADISEAFLRSWEDSNGTEPMWALFSFDDQAVFVTDLRQYMTDASA